MSDAMFDRDIALYEIMEGGIRDAMTERIHGALREALTCGPAHPSGYFRDSPSGITEIEGEYDLAFIARVIRAAIDG